MSHNISNLPTGIDSTSRHSDCLASYPKKTNKGEAQYSYAFNEQKELINIAHVDDHYRKNHRFYCIHCGDEMIAYIKDDKRCRHFTHKINRKCNYETYLHSLSKNLIKSTFDNTNDFLLDYTVTESCERENCPLRSYSCNKENSSGKINIKDWYDICELEKEVKGENGQSYVADILLSCSYSNRPPLLLEIHVTHECTDEKKKSGLRIVEIDINSEDDIFKICEDRCLSESKKIRFYCFKRNKNVQMTIDILRYIHLPEKDSYMTNIRCDREKDVADKESDLEINITYDNFEAYEEYNDDV